MLAKNLELTQNPNEIPSLEKQLRNFINSEGNDLHMSNIQLLKTDISKTTNHSIYHSNLTYKQKSPEKQQEPRKTEVDINESKNQKKKLRELKQLYYKYKLQKYQTHHSPWDKTKWAIASGTIILLFAIAYQFLFGFWDPTSKNLEVSYENTAYTSCSQNIENLINIYTESKLMNGIPYNKSLYEEEKQLIMKGLDSNYGSFFYVLEGMPLIGYFLMYFDKFIFNKIGKSKLAEEINNERIRTYRNSATIYLSLKLQKQQNKIMDFFSIFDSGCNPINFEKIIRNHMKSQNITNFLIIIDDIQLAFTFENPYGLFGPIGALADRLGIRFLLVSSENPVRNTIKYFFHFLSIFKN